MPEVKFDVTVPEGADGKRMDAALTLLIPGRSRSVLQKAIAAGCASCNGKTVTESKEKVRTGDVLSVTLADSPPPQVAGETAPFEYLILYEDDSLLVIDKPAGVVVHPGAGNWSGTIVNAMQSRYPGWIEQWSLDDLRPGIIHRLDKETCGCLVIAKTPLAQSRLSASFAERKTGKTYYALAHGFFHPKSGDLGGLIGRHPVNRQKMAVVDRNGKEALSHYEAVKQGLIDGVAVSLVKVNIFTGRTHQIRVHLSSIRHPVLGDALYGGNKGLDLPHQMLFAAELRFPHPTDNREVVCTAPMPEDFAALLNRMEEK